jgi:5-methylcytosine-specific restriction protein A
MRTSRLCRCGEIVQGNCGKCDQAKQAKADDYRTPKHLRYPPGWAKLSLLYRKENPLCEVCADQGKATPATEVHHIIPVRQNWSLSLDRSNLISVCRRCHEELEKEQKN